MTQLEITAPPRMQTHAENLERVSDRIAGSVMEFCRARIGRSFYMGQLTDYVRDQAGIHAPDSPGRILRSLRQKQLVGYELLSRSESLYKVLWVRQ